MRGAIDPLLRMTGLSLEEFARSCWGVAPLLRRAAHLPGDGFADLLSPDDVDELLSRRGVRTPFVRMSRDGDVLSPSRFTRGGGAGAEIGDQVADDKVLAEFSAGATIVLQGLHRLWPPIRAFADSLRARIGHPVQVNAYVTPPQNTGFAPHYDVHDVFVLQFAGRKRWRIHEPVLEAPLRDQPWNERKDAVAARASEAPLLETVLEPGDTLYLPRGYLHAATSLGEISGHLTVGIHSVTRKTLVDQIFASLSGEVELRRSLPPGEHIAEDAAFETEFDATIRALRAAIDRVDRAAVARGVRRHVAANTRPSPIRPLAQAKAATALSPERRVRLRPGLRVAFRDEGDRAAIELPDKTVRISKSAVEAARAATSGEWICALDLPNANVADGVALLSQLLRDGIVVPE